MGELSTSVKLPIFLNLFIITMFIYVNFAKEEPEKRNKTLKNWVKPIFFINTLALVMHSLLGGVTKTKKRVLEPLWKIDKEKAVQIIAVYLVVIAVTGTIILVSKYKNKDKDGKEEKDKKIKKK